MTIKLSHQGLRCSKIGCEGCGKTIGLMILGLWIELPLHRKDCPE